MRGRLLGCAEEMVQLALQVHVIDLGCTARRAGDSVNRFEEVAAAPAIGRHVSKDIDCKNRPVQHAACVGVVPARQSGLSRAPVGMGESQCGFMPQPGKAIPAGWRARSVAQRRIHVLAIRRPARRCPTAHSGRRACAMHEKLLLSGLPFGGVGKSQRPAEFLIWFQGRF
jgi:hypothetical protein